MEPFFAYCYASYHLHVRNLSFVSMLLDSFTLCVIFFPSYQIYQERKSQGAYSTQKVQLPCVTQDHLQTP